VINLIIPNVRLPYLSKSSDIARQTVRASAIIVGGDITWALLSAILLLIVARLLGPYGYGAYTVALVLPNVFQSLSGFGLSVSINRFSAHYISRNEPKIALRMTKNGVLAFVIISCVLAAINYFGANFLAADLLKRPDLAFLVQLGSLVIVGQAMLAASISAYVGWNYSGYASISQVIESIVELVLSPSLILILGLSVLGGVLGHLLSYVAAGTLSTFLLSVLLSKRTRSGGMDDLRFFLRDTKTMINYGFSQFAGGFLAIFSRQYYTLIILSATVANALVAYYQAAFNVMAAVSLVATALAISLLPGFTKLHTLSKDTQLAFKYATTYISFVTTPFVFFVISASGDIVSLLYGARYGPSVDTMSLLAIASLPFTLGMAVLPPFFNAIAKTRLTFFTYLVSALSLFILTPLLTLYLRMGLNGVVYSQIVCGFAGLFTGLLLAKKYVGADYSYTKNLLIAVTCITGAIPLFIISRFWSIAPLVEILIDIVVYFMIYLTVAPLIGIMDKNDLRRLSSWTNGLGFLSRISDLLIRYETTLARSSAEKSPD